MHRWCLHRPLRPLGAALFVSRLSKVPFIENNISLIEFAREKVA